MHILMLPSWYATKRNKVHGSFFKENAEALVEQGIKVSVAFNEVWPITQIGKIREKSGLSYTKDGMLPTYRYKGYNFLPKNPLMFHLFNKRFDKLFKEVQKKEGKIDVIHAHSSFWAGIGGMYLKEKYNIPLVITEHSSLKNSRYVKESYIPYIKKSYTSCDKLIAVGNGLKDELYSLCKRDDIKVIHNLVDLDKFTLKREDYKKDNTIIFFSCGFLDIGKGFDSLIKAFNEGFKDKDAVLRIGGDGEERENLKDLIKSLNLEDKVILLGKLTRDEVAKEMKDCDVFALASRHETFGVVYIEALACGKPIVATDNGGSSDIVKGINGIIVSVDNIKEIKNAMLHVSKNLNNYDKYEIRENCIKRFSKDSIIPRIIKVYEELK